MSAVLNLNKKRIRAGELLGYEYAQSYKNIGACLLLYFKTPPFVRPVRPHRWAEYKALLNAWERKVPNRL